MDGSVLKNNYDPTPIGSISGGGLYSYGDATLNNSTVTGNTATRYGGGIASFSMLTITDSVISSNTAPHHGGGIYFKGISLNMTNTLVIGNAQTKYAAGCSSCLGGGINKEGGTITLTDSTITGNSAGLEGGGLATRSGSSAGITLVNTTITGNSASFDPDCSYIAEQPENGC